MDPLYLFACGIVWRKTGDGAAGRELVLALSDGDPEIEFLAERLLVNAGPVSLELLERAVSSGVLEPERGALCILEVLDGGCEAVPPWIDYRETVPVQVN